MVGSGKIGTQPTDDVAVLPSSQILSESKSGSSGSNSGSGGDNADQSHSSGVASGRALSGGHGSVVVAVVGVGAVTMVVLSALL